MTTEYLNRPLYDDVSEAYYAAPVGHPMIQEDKLVRKTLAPEGEGAEEEEHEKIPDDVVFLAYDFDEACQILVVRLCFDDWTGDYERSPHDDDIITTGRGLRAREWLVVTDDKADRLWNERLENILDDAILPELPEFAQAYFDREAWKRDARFDGRGHALSPYDGNEEYEDIEGYETMYIYRLA